MDMLDRYLQAVRFFLPAQQQDDIVNVSFQIGFVVAAVITVFEIVRALRRLKHRRVTPLSSDSAAARAER